MTLRADRSKRCRRSLSASRRRGDLWLPEGYDPQDITILWYYGWTRETSTAVQLESARTSKSAFQLQTLLAAPNGELIMSLTVGIAHELKSWILGFGPNVRVLEPQSLVEEIRDLHSNAALNY